jgi:hypothetical protein
LTDPGKPEPPEDPSTLDPLVEPLPGGTELWRIHRLEHGAAHFNPGVGRGRFHPFPGSGGAPVATLYAAETWEGAVCEAVFRDVPLRGPDRRKARAEFEIRAMSRVRLTRDVPLVDLRTLGLRRLGLHRQELIDTEAEEYPRTSRWARAFHQARPDAGGLVWMARLADLRAMVFFGDRLTEKDFAVFDDPLPLGEGEGLAMVMELAEKAKILITE